MTDIVRGATNSSPWTTETVKELFDRLLTEHDRRYEDRFKAQEQAVKAAFTAAETAAAKLEVNQKHTNEQQNEWRKTVQDFKDGTISRETFSAAMKSVEDKIGRNTEDIRRIETRLATGAGGSDALAERRKQSNWLVGVIIAVALNFIGMIVAFIYFLAGRP